MVRWEGKYGGVLSEEGVEEGYNLNVRVVSRLRARGWGVKVGSK